MVISDNEIIRIMNEVAKHFLIPHFLEMGMNASGEWVNSIEVHGSNNVGIIRGRDYTEYLVNGRGPGKMPPIAKIQSWAGHKFGLSGQQARAAAFAIAKKIAKEGTEYYKEGGTDLLDILNSQQVTDYITGEIRGLIKKSVVSQIEDFSI